MTKRKVTFIILHLLLTVLVSCDSAPKMEDIVSNLINRKYSFGKDNIEYELADRNYTIVTYIDSIGCVACKLKLDDWKKFTTMLHSIDKTIKIVFIAHQSVRKELPKLLKGSDFYPNLVIYDEDEKLKHANNIPDELLLQTVLLSECNEILLVGNPVHNKNIKSLMINTIKKRNRRKEQY